MADNYNEFKYRAFLNKEDADTAVQVAKLLDLPVKELNDKKQFMIYFTSTSWLMGSFAQILDKLNIKWWYPFDFQLLT